MKTSLLRLLSLSLVVLGASSVARAGGPNYLDYVGGYAKWNTSQPIPFTVDNGPLKKLGNTVLISRDVGRQIIDEETGRWTNVPTSTLILQDSGFLDVDVTVNNISAVLNDASIINPVIFDADGSIITALYGASAADSILGYAGATRFVGDEIRNGQVVLNGTQASASGLSGVGFRQTVTHELGHLVGLDHTLGLYSNWVNGNLADVPMMFPIGIDGATSDPITDDIAWLSWLYPTQELSQTTGTIRGNIYWLRPGGPIFQGANVEAIPAIPDGNGGFTQSTSNVVTCVSDFLASGTGEYELPNLAPGYYYVRIEPIPMRISGVEIVQGSGIGPFDSRSTSFLPDFYDPEESATEDPQLKTVIHVSAGQTVSGIDLVPNDLAGIVQLTPEDTSGVPVSLGDDASRLVIFPSNFVFPFYGHVYHELYVNSDGNLTFGSGDSSSDARDEARFLSGPPRIAPLFTDLDPSGGKGQIVAAVGEGFVRFSWLGVPEFIDQGTAPGNTFIVTLYSNGDVRFEYAQISVTADQIPGLPADPQVIVGVGPGHVNTGVTTVLSSAVEFPMGQEALYQVFLNSTFNLSGRAFTFTATSNDLLFPFLSGSTQDFTGFAISNYGTGDALLAADGRSDDGNLLSGGSNPASIDLPAESQFAALGKEIFGIATGQSFEGWARVRSDQPQVGSFFQFGKLSGGTVTQLDGSAAFTAQSQKLYFTRLYSGPVFPTLSGFKEAATWLSLVNPNDVTINLTLRLYANMGQPVGPDVSRSIPPNGRIYETLAAMFSLQSPIADGFVEVTVDGPGAIGFELVQLPDGLLGLNAAVDNPSNVGYSAQLGHSRDVFTSVKVVNPTATAANITMTAYIRQSDGTIDVRPTQFSLGPKQSVQQNVENLFALGPGGTTQIVGSIKVESTVNGVIGDVVFGDPQTAKFIAALPLQTVLFRKAINGQVSNGRYVSNPSLDSFTGIALFNPNQVQAQVTVEVFDRDGAKIGEKILTLSPNERISKVLYESDFIPDTLGLVRGYVVITSNQPIVAQELFGNNTLDYLSAVVPTVIE